MRNAARRNSLRPGATQPGTSGTHAARPGASRPDSSIRGARTARRNSAASRSSALRRGLAIAGAALSAVGLAGWVGVLSPASPAQAHNYLISSVPAAGTVLTELPARFSVTTNDTLLDFGGGSSGSSGELQVRGPDGLYYGDGCVDVTGPSISTAAALGAAGEYTVAWRVVSADGHPVSNQFAFTWQPDASQPSSSGSTSAPACASAGDAPDAATATPATAAGDASKSPATASKDDEFVSVLTWTGGAIVAVAAAVTVTLLLLRKPKRPRSE